MKNSQEEICVYHNQPIVVIDKNISHQKQQGLCLICVQMMFQDDNIISVYKSDAQQKEMINATIVECQNHIDIMNNLTAKLNEFKNNVNMNIDKLIEFLSGRSVYVKKQLQIIQQPDVKFNPGVLEKQKLKFDKYIGKIRLQLDYQLQRLINIKNVKQLKVLAQRMGDNIQKYDLNDSDSDLEIQELLQNQIEQTQQQIRETQQQIACTKKEQIEIQYQNKNQESQQQTQQQIQNSEGKQSHTLQQIQKTTEAILRAKEQILKN